MFSCQCGLLLLLLLLQPREGILKNLFVKRLNCFGGKETSVTERRRERESVGGFLSGEEGRKEGRRDFGVVLGWMEE